MALYWGSGLSEYGCVIGGRRGVRDNETLRSYPCSDFADPPTRQAWRGVRVEAPAEARWRTSRLKAPALSVGGLIMARRQLLNLKQLAERHRHQDWPEQD